MNDKIKPALAFYEIGIKNAEALNEDGDAYKLTDCAGVRYFLKIYGKENDYDIIPNIRVYHTYEQIQTESEILCALAGSALNTAVPIKNICGGYVTALAPGSDGEPVYATVTSFIDGMSTKPTQAPTEEMAYVAGVSAALLHTESKKRLLPLAVKRPHKRQDYMHKALGRIASGIETGAVAAAQYETIRQCCDVITDCMDRLDKDMEDNVGLVHTDIINGNIIYTPGRATFIDFSRSVYSYYMYDLAEMCLHANFGGSGPELQKAILRGYNSIKPLTYEHFFAMQALFAMFIFMLFAITVESTGNEWFKNTLAWVENEVRPGLLSGKGYMDPSVFDGITTAVEHR